MIPTTTMKESRSSNNSPNSTYGTRSVSVETNPNESGRTPRKFWWSPTRNQVEIPTEPVKHRDAQSKVGSLANIEYRSSGGQVVIQDQPVKWKALSRVNSLSNASWSPSSSAATIRHEKLKWNAQPKINSLNNLKYKPRDSVVHIYDEKTDFEHVTPRIDTGFV